MTPMKEVVPGFALPTVTFAKDQPQYLPLPAVVSDGVVTTRWKLTWRERLTLFLGGTIWLQVSTFGRPLQPVKLDVDCPIFGHAMEDEEKE